MRGLVLLSPDTSISDSFTDLQASWNFRPRRRLLHVLRQVSVMMVRLCRYFCGVREFTFALTFAGVVVIAPNSHAADINVVLDRAKLVKAGLRT